MQDIAPNLAGTVLGLTNCVGSVPGFVAPSIAGQITNSNNKDTDKWDLVWMIAVIILAVESVFYIIFASGEPQPWNFPDPDLEGKPREKKRDWFSVSSYLFSYSRQYITANCDIRLSGVTQKYLGFLCL